LERNYERKYSRIRAEAADIIQGHKRISCLPEEAERGRVEGGLKTIEASCLIGRYEKADAQDTNGIKKSQELKLEKWAKYEKIWFDHADIRENWKRIDNGDSREAEVYGFEETKTVRKVFRYDALDSDYTPISFINDRISVHNALFPTTKYKLFGFTQTDKGFFAFILEQPFIDGAERPTKEEIKEYMKLRGFPNNDGYSYHWNDYYVVGDFTPVMS
jgi:hypothetical protein